MKRAAGIAAALGTVLLLAACSHGGDGGRGRGAWGGNLRPIADPGRVVATELSFARVAREKGQWTAFAEYAADGAILFSPGPVNARDWLKGRANPSVAAVWEPHRVVSSCDGSLAASFGKAILPDNSIQDYLTLWQRQKNGAYKWLLDTGEESSAAQAVPDGGRAALIETIKSDFVATQVAICRKPVDSAVDGEAGPAGGHSADETLRWGLSDTDGGERLTVDYWDGASFQTVYDRLYPAVPGS